MTVARTTVADVSKTAAVLEERIEGLGGRLSVTTAAVERAAEGRQEDRVEVAMLNETVRGLGKSVAALQAQLAECDKARLADHVELVRLREEVAATRKESSDATAKTRDLEKENAGLKQEQAVTRQQLAEHLKRVEVWDARRWALVAVLVSSLLAMASGLVVALAKR